MSNPERRSPRFPEPEAESLKKSSLERLVAVKGPRARQGGEVDPSVSSLERLVVVEPAPSRH
jgi:hypothetical protein